MKDKIDQYTSACLFVYLSIWIHSLLICSQSQEKALRDSFFSGVRLVNAYVTDTSG